MVFRRAACSGVRCAAGMPTPVHSFTRAASSARVSFESVRQAHPQRVLRLVGPRMVAADVLVDHAQVEPEVVGAVAAAEHAAGEQHAVVGAGLAVRPAHTARPPSRPRRRRSSGRAAACGAAGRSAHENLAQALGVLGRHRHAVAAAPVGRAGPGVAGLHRDGPALQVLPRCAPAWAGRSRGRRGRASPAPVFQSFGIAIQ